VAKMPVISRGRGYNANGVKGKKNKTKARREDIDLRGTRKKSGNAKAKKSLCHHNFEGDEAPISTTKTRKKGNRRNTKKDRHG